MKKEIYGLVFFLLITISLVFAQGAKMDSPGDGGRSDPPNIPELYSENPGNGLPNEISGETTNEFTVQERVMARDGSYVGQDGKQIMLNLKENDRIQMNVGNSNALVNLNMMQGMVEGKSIFSAELSNGRNAEIKVMPDSASETALKRLRLNSCLEENNCSIELKEVGQGQEIRAAYEFKTMRKSKLFGLIPKNMEVQVQVDAENGEILSVNKPWWSFLASEPAEI